MRHSLPVFNCHPGHLSLLLPLSSSICLKPFAASLRIQCGFLQNIVFCQYHSVLHMITHYLRFTQHFIYASISVWTFKTEFYLKIHLLLRCHYFLLILFVFRDAKLLEDEAEEDYAQRIVDGHAVRVLISNPYSFIHLSYTNTYEYTHLFIGLSWLS